MVRNPGKHQRSKQRGQDLCWKVYDLAHLLFYVHTLCMNYVIAMFSLVSCMNARNHLLYFVRFCAGSTHKNSEQKHITKNFAGLPNHFPLLTMIKGTRMLNGKRGNGVAAVYITVAANVTPTSCR